MKASSWPEKLKPANKILKISAGFLEYFFHSKRLAQDGEDTGSFKIKEMENFLSHHKKMVNSNYLVKYYF